jgi:hypothetical protein
MGGKEKTMSKFTPLSQVALVEFNRNTVKKHYLPAVGTALMGCGKSIAIQYLTPQIMKVSAEKIEELKKAFSFFCAEYTPTMTGKNGMSETPPYFTVSRNMTVTVEGHSRKSSENTASVNDRQRLGKGNGVYRWNPNGILIVKNSESNCADEKKWIIKTSSGKVIAHSRVLNAEAWGFVAGLDREGNAIK